MDKYIFINQTKGRLGKIFLGRHRVRANLYHLFALVFIISTTLWAMDFIDDRASFVLTAILFVLDYLAEMYDPHPDNPGPWFKAHFQRLVDDNLR